MHIHTIKNNGRIGNLWVKKISELTTVGVINKTICDHLVVDRILKGVDWVRWLRLRSAYRNS